MFLRTIFFFFNSNAHNLHQHSYKIRNLHIRTFTIHISIHACERITQKKNQVSAECVDSIVSSTNEKKKNKIKAEDKYSITKNCQTLLSAYTYIHESKIAS